MKDFDIPKSEDQCRAKLREIFNNNKHVSDIRVIDMLVIKVSSKIFVLIPILIFYAIIRFFFR